MEALNTEQNQNFGLAIAALKNGHAVARKGWIPHKKFIFMQVPSTIPADIIPKMQSLPDSVKRIFDEPTRVAISYTDQICMQDDRGLLVNYAPSCSDVLAEDWNVIS